MRARVGSCIVGFSGAVAVDVHTAIQNTEKKMPMGRKKKSIQKNNVMARGKLSTITEWKSQRQRMERIGRGWDGRPGSMVERRGLRASWTRSV